MLLLAMYIADIGDWRGTQPRDYNTAVAPPNSLTLDAATPLLET